MIKEILDPRFQRLDVFKAEHNAPTQLLDQLPTYEVFILLRDGGKYQHEGIVHAPDKEMAFIFAKEQYSRRMMCAGIWTIETSDIFVSAYSENKISVYDDVEESSKQGILFYEIFHLLKRGKQHKHAGTVLATGYNHALQIAKSALDISKPVLNVWIAKVGDFYKSTEEDKEMWNTLPEKTFREAIDYKGQAKIEEYLANKDKNI